MARRRATGQGDIKELTRGLAFNGVWAPDGTRLYFAAGGERRGDIYTVRADGSDERALSDFRNRRGTLVTNSLATDGRYLYFSWQEDLGDLWIAEVVK